MDMLHAPENKVAHSTNIWHDLYANRSKFYSSQMNGLFGHIATEAHKYGLRGMRSLALSEVLDVVNSYPITPDTLVRELTHLLPADNNYTRFLVDHNQKAGFQDFYEVLGRKYQFSIKAEMFKQGLDKLWNEVGERTKQAQADGGVSWKAMSHAFRVGYQLLDIYNEGDYTFPLKQSPFLMEVKNGKLELNYVQELLQDLVSNVKTAAGKSGLPKTIDPAPWKDYVFDVYKNEVVTG